MILTNRNFWAIIHLLVHSAPRGGQSARSVAMRFISQDTSQDVRASVLASSLYGTRAGSNKPNKLFIAVAARRWASTASLLLFSLPLLVIDSGMQIRPYHIFNKLLQEMAIYCDILWFILKNVFAFFSMAKNMHGNLSPWKSLEMSL